MVESLDRPVVGVVDSGGRFRRLEGLPDDGRVLAPLVGARGALGTDGGRGGCEGVVYAGDAAAAGSGGDIGDAALDVFCGDGVKNSRLFLGFDGVSSSFDGDVACDCVRTSAVGETGAAATDGGVASLLLAADGPGGEGLID